MAAYLAYNGYFGVTGIDQSEFTEKNAAEYRAGQVQYHQTNG